MMEASNQVLDRVVQRLAIPRRHTTTIREIWQMQFRLERRSGKRAFRLLELNKFRAGYDFLLMRGELEGGNVKALAEWWSAFQNADHNLRQLMVNDLGKSVPEQGKTRRRRTPRNKTKPT
jgi:poly(A) polymerase